MLLKIVHRECLKLAEGLKLRVHLLNKVKELVKKTSKKGQIKAGIFKQFIVN